MNIKQQIIASCIVLAGSVFAFDAALTDPLAWLYADSKIATAERLDEVDVPANGVVDVNILVNGLKPGERLEFDASEKDGEWYRMRAVPVARNTGVNGFLEKNPGDNPHVARRAPFEVFDVLEPMADRWRMRATRRARRARPTMLSSRMQKRRKVCTSGYRIRPREQSRSTSASASSREMKSGNSP